MKKKKGFTLIEVVVAIAVLSIAMVGITSAMYSGTKISAKNTKKVNTSVYAGNIMQTLKSKGKEKLITDFKLDENNLPSTKCCYCYFDNEDELKKILNAGIDPQSDAKESLKAGTGTETELEMKTDSSGLAAGKKYGAYVKIELSRIFNSSPGVNGSFTPESGINFLKIYVKVIKLKEAENTDSSLVFYLGR